ncbi:MAG: hypothetical protein KDC34_15965 [Saprospiraceae bacterium]|nr:hypothetical protein [Saprospiraceae bacterium]
MMEKIVCMGDSLTDGYGIVPAYRWSDLLASALNIEVINSGISGDTTTGMLARFQNMVIAHAPSQVIIMGGTNDLSLNLPDVQILANILAMTRYARFHNIGSIIGIPTPFFTEDKSNLNSVFLNPGDLKNRIHTFRNKLMRFAQEEGLPFIDFACKLKKDCFLDDGLHPNISGHRLMMENAYEVVQEVFATSRITSNK